jgi:16S rRNA C1402 N4-methylase RsmH
MPNQLSRSKRRQSLAEHEAVLVALAEIARREDTTVMALLRQAAREFVRNRATEPIQTERLRQLVLQKAPRMPALFKTAAQVARFKRAQREFDQVLLDLGLASPQAIQQRNSIASVIAESLDTALTKQQQVWADIAERRTEELSRGKVSGVPADEVFAKARQRLGM